MDTSANRAPWWRGQRGEWLVVAQAVVMVLVFFGPRAIGGWPRALHVPQALVVVGNLLLVAGGLLFVAGLLRLGKALTPMPYPKDNATLRQDGPFAMVRHPVYSGGLVLSFGWALAAGSWLTFGYVAALFVILDVKSRREERWLVERFPEYHDYQRRVRRLIPFVY